MTRKPFYITTTLPYVNAEPHIGHALEFVRADIIARAHALKGEEVFFNTGTDEHGIKIYQKAVQMHVDTQVYVDQASAKFKEILPLLGLATDEEGIKFNFIRTTDAHHVKAAQDFWKLVEENGKKAKDGPYIYKKNYSIKYCIGCELEKTESELVLGRCPLHPLQDLEIITEENYFFKFSAFQEKLLKMYADKPDFVLPSARLNEIRSFVERGLQDFSISRLASKMPWGVPVPGDDSQVMYVWFDALVDYISAVGWPDDEVAGKNEAGAFDKWWVKSGGVVQYCGKDNLRQQTAMWQAMLMAAGLPNSKTVVVNGFVTGEGGVKMSKSLGNVINPIDVVKEYGTDALRYYVARDISPFEDSPFTLEKFKESYNANLANGIGNLTSRIMKMAETNGVAFDAEVSKKLAASAEMKDLYKRQMGGFDSYDIKQATDAVWSLISATDKIIQDSQPFKVIKTDKEEGEKIIKDLIVRLEMIGTMLKPILPNTSHAILRCIADNKMPREPLFLRK